MEAERNRLEHAVGPIRRSLVGSSETGHPVERYPTSVIVGAVAVSVQRLQGSGPLELRNEQIVI
jgi:hypothetical protein